MDTSSVTAEGSACISERQNSILTKGKSKSSIHCADDCLAGSVSQRACVFCGARVVLNTVPSGVPRTRGTSGGACRAVPRCTGTASRPT
jgi:nitrogenase molybdenum-cofactor synthesis protein NifE